MRGIEPTYDMPLFLKGRKSNGEIQGVAPKNIQDMLREVALKSGLVDKEMNGKDFNPLGPHALRESFGSIMINSGVPDTIVDFWLGHSIGELAEAYKSVQLKSLRNMYLDRERLLSVSQPKIDLEEVEKKVRMEIEESSKELQALVNRLARDNIEMKDTVKELQSQMKKITEGRKESDEIMNRLFEDPEFRELLRKKLKELA